MKPKVTLALPLWRIMYGESVSNLVNLLMTFPFYSALIAENFRVDRGRETMTEAFMASGGDYMFCLDSDMVIPQGAVERLLSHKLPLVGGLYVSRHEQHWPFVWNEQRDEAGHFQDFQVVAEWPEGALIPCDITGAGFLLIAREIFESFGPPWWILDEGDEGGTDIAFLRRARAAGWQLYVDTGLQAKHLDIRPWTLSHFISWREENRDRIIDPATREVEYVGDQNA